MSNEHLPGNRFYEFFAGGGMARAGLAEAWECVFANDIDPKKRASYSANWGDDHLKPGSVADLTTADLLGRADLAWASAKRVLEFFTAQIDWLVTGHVLEVNPAHPVRGPNFRTTGRKTGEQREMWQQDAYRMIQRRARAAGIKTRICNHTFRATGITTYLKNEGKLEHAQSIANHSSPRTTKLYDRRENEISLDEVERIAI